MRILFKERGDAVKQQRDFSSNNNIKNSYNDSDRSKRHSSTFKTKLMFLAAISVILISIIVLLINNHMTENEMLTKNNNNNSTDSSDEILSLEAAAGGGFYINDDKSIVAKFNSANNEGEVVLHCGIAGGTPTINKDLLLEFFNNCGKSNIKRIVISGTMYAPYDSSALFSGLSNLNTITNSTNLKFTGVALMNELFLGCESLKEIDTSYWVTNTATTTAAMFKGCSDLTKILGTNTWQLSNVTQMGQMFQRCSSLVSLEASAWNLQNVTAMNEMFDGCRSLTEFNAPNLKVNSITTMQSMFKDCNSLTNVNMADWQIGNSIWNMFGIFENCSQLVTINMNNWNTWNVTVMEGLFKNCESLTEIVGIENLDVSHVQNMGSMFCGCKSLKKLNLNKWDTSSATNMWGLFHSCVNLEEILVDAWGDKTSKVDNMGAMFYSCQKLTTVGVQGWNTSSLKLAGNMFDQCTGLQTIDVSRWNTQNLENMDRLFGNCSELTTIDVSNWNTGRLISAVSTFEGCTGLTEINLGKWNTTRLQSAKTMFNGCSNVRVIYLNNWDVSRLSQHSGMFANCDQLYEIYAPKTIPTSKSIELPASDYRDIDSPEDRGNSYSTLNNSVQTKHLFRGIFIIFDVEEVKDYVNTECAEYLQPEAIILPKVPNTEENIFPEGAKIFDETRALNEKGYVFKNWRMGTKTDTKVVVNPYRSKNFDSDVIYTPIVEIMEASYQVYYWEQGTDDTERRELRDPITVEDVEFGTTIVARDKVENIVGYEFVRADPETLVISVEDNVINLYYRKRSDLKYTVKYLEKGNPTVKLRENKVVENVTFKTVIDALSEKEEFYGYNFDSASPERLEVGVNEANNVINLYYTKKDSSVIVHHYLQNTTTSIADDVIILGKVGDEYHTTVAENLPSKYELVQAPPNATGVMEEETIELTYYYVIRRGTVNVYYKEKDTDNELAEPEEIVGIVDENYNIEAKEVEGYTVVEPIGNITGQFTSEPKTVTFYYLKNTRVVVQHIDVVSDEIIEEEFIDGLVGDEFITEPKIFDDYRLVEEPEQKTGTMTREEIVLKYYYRHVAGGVIEQHIDAYDKTILYTKTYEGFEGDSYDIPAKEFEGYDLVEERIPANRKGTMIQAPIVVTYEYTKRTQVQAKYLDAVTGEELAPPLIINGHKGDKYRTFEKEVAEYELIAIPANKEGIMLEDVTEVIYYYGSPSRVVVRYLDIDTNQKIANEEIITGNVNDRYETHPKEVQYYDLVEIPANATGVMTRETIEVIYYYRLRPTSVIVHHYLEGTTTKVAQDVIIEGKINDNYVTTIATDLPGKYEIAQEPANKVGKMTENPIEVIYYYKVKSARVIVHHYIEGTETRVAQDVTLTGKVDENYTTTVSREVPSKYELVREPDNKTGKFGESTIEVIYYYRLKSTSVIVHHYLEGTTTKVAQDVIIEGKVDDSYTTTVSRDVPSKYELVGEPANKTGKMTENVIEVTYYYRLKSTRVIVHHYIEGTTTRVAPDVIISGRIDDNYETSVSREVPSKYDLVREPDNKTGKFSENTIEVTYYYRLKATRVIVHYYLEETTTRVAEDVIIEGRVEDDYETTASRDVPSKYELVSEPANKRGTMTESPIEVVYYYRLKSTRVIVHHYLEGTTTRVAEDIIIEGKVDDNYETTASENVPSKYELVGDPDNETGTMTESPIEVIYYYRLKSTRVVVHHYLEGTTTKVAQDVTIEGKINDNYSTTIATDLPSKYELASEPDNKTGKFGESTIEVIYYYRLKTTKVIVHHYEEGTTNKLSEDVEIEGPIDSEYRTEAATDIPIKYTLVEVPENSEGIMTEEVIEVFYYYTIKEAILNIYYLEKDTDIELARPERKTGKVDENYSVDGKEIEGYTMVEHSGNTTGRFGVEPITVTYYYLKNTRATVQYIDIRTNEILEERTEEGLVGDEFVTETKIFDNYILVSEPEQKTVNMTKEEIVLKYYYRHISDGVIEQHIDVISGEVLDNQIHRGNEGDTYNIPAKEFEGYDLVEDRLPENNKGTMGREPITVTYYYIHRATVRIQYIDKATGEKLGGDTVKNGHEGDSYTTESKTFEGYKLVETPENSSGNMTKEDIIVIYYYSNKTQVQVKYIEQATGEEIADTEIIEGNIGDDYVTEEKEIPGYDLIEVPENSKGKMTEDVIEVIYYYAAQEAVLDIYYLEKDTDIELASPERKIGKVGEDYSIDAKEIEGYTMVEHSENTTGKFTAEPITVTYYYLKNTRATVQYIDIKTNEILEERTEEGLVGDEFVTETKVFDNYNLVSEPEQKTVNMTKEEIVLKYYYIYISAGVLEQHIDVISGEVLHNQIHEGNEGDEYDIAAKEFDGYDLVEDRLPENSTGTMERDQIVVTYYYIHRATVKVQYLDKITGEKLEEDIVKNGHEGDSYTTESKTFEGYKLVGTPENSSGNMTKEEILVTYYYSNKTQVKVKYIEKATGEELVVADIIEGGIGEDYNTEEKEISGYYLIEIPENKEGKMTEDVIEVIYYYAKLSKVITNYYDIDTKEKIAEEVVIEGREDEEYETEQKEIEYYNLVEVPKNAKGTIEKEDIEVNYYYKKKEFNLKVEKKVKQISYNGQLLSVNSNIGKIEVDKKSVTSAEVLVTYEIKVKNTSELTGKAELVENIPNGMIMAGNDNHGWVISQNTASLSVDDIEPGKERVYTVIMRWNQTEDNLGMKKNTVEIVKTQNKAGFEEITLEDNKATADFVISIITGAEDNTIIERATLAILLILAMAGIVYIMKK